MALLITTIVLFLITMFAAVVYLSNRGRHKVFLVLPFFTFVLLVFGMFTKISANEVGIIYDDRSGVQDEVKYEGFQVKSIFEHITKISTTNKTAQTATTGQTEDAIYASFEITIIYRIDAENAGKFFKKTGASDISNDQLNSLVKQALQSSTIHYSIYDILGGELENTRNEFYENLATLLSDQYFISLVSVSFDDIDAGATIETIIQDKGEALQQIEIALAEQEKARVEAETILIQAQAQADAVEIAAAAEAVKIAAEKEAVADLFSYYQAQLPNLTDAEIAQIVLNVLYYSTWDGVLPDVISDGTGIIVNP